uniref:Uncharacterized protein n=1 Tax=Anopheles merus TaxID=30066 RepID=A0A182VCQ9_ANOME
MLLFFPSLRAFRSHGRNHGLLALPRYQMVPKSGKLDPSRGLPSVATGPMDGARGKQWILGRLALIGLAGPGQKDIRKQCSAMRRGPGTRPDAVNHPVLSLARVNERSAGGWTANVWTVRTGVLGGIKHPSADIAGGSYWQLGNASPSALARCNSVGPRRVPSEPRGTT